MDGEKILKQEHMQEDQNAAVTVKRIPVVEEQLHIGKQAVETGKVRILKKVKEDEFNEDIPVFKEEVTVERKQFNQFIEGDVPGIRLVGDTTIIPVMKEVIVKRILLIEELHITKRSIEQSVSVQGTLLREEVTVERSDNIIHTDQIKS